MSVCGTCGAMRLEQWTTCPFCGPGLDPPDAPIAAAPTEVPVATSPAATADTPTMPKSAPSEVKPQRPGVSDAPLVPNKGLVWDRLDASNDDASATADSDSQADASLALPASDVIDLDELDVDVEARPAAANGSAGSDTAPTPTDDFTEDNSAEESPMPAPIVAALALIAVILIGTIGYFFFRGDSPPTDLAMVDSITTTSVSGDSLDQPSNQGTPEAIDDPIVETAEAIAVLGSELAPQLQAICAGEQTSLAGAAVASTSAFNEIITVTFDPSTDGWLDPSDHPVYSTVVPSLVRCDSIADAETLYFCDDYEDGYSYAGIVSDWSSRLIQTADGTVLYESSGRNEDVGDCPDALTVYDDNKEIVSRAGFGPAATTAAALYPTGTGPACVRPTADGFQAIAANNPALNVPVPVSWIGTTNEAGAATLCVGHRAEVDRNDACQTIVSANAIGADGRLINAWSYVHGDCDWSVQPPMPPAEWFQNIVGPALGYPPA